jgi:hypothetical protein
MSRRKKHKAGGRDPKAAAPRGLGRLRLPLALAAVVFLAAALVGGLLFRNLSSDSGPPPGPKTAAIVDQLSLSFPNPTFADSATDLLQQAGYVVDYYAGEEVTVEFYQALPTHGYDLILLRVHSGLARDRGEPTGYVSLFSGEPYDETKYAKEEADGLLGRARQFEGGPEYFGIVPAFIDSSMRGRFENTTVILMGCDGLITDKTADAFIRKGAEVVVGWDDAVSAAHTDAATERLLRHLLIDQLATPDAVAQAMAEVGPDPQFDSTLLYYP